MPAPGIVTGSNSATALFRNTGTGTETGTALGVFGRNPGSTPKYALNVGRRDAEYRETMARLFVEVPTQLNTFLGSITPETQALARVLATGGNTAGSGGTGFIDFLLTSAQESFSEKAQIVDTLTDNFVAFYSGQAPPLFTYSGTVLNTYQDDQRVWLFRLYREILRGSRLAGRGLIARLRYDSFIVSGYLESLTQSISGDTDHQAGQFQFTMRVQHMTVFTPSIGMPTIASTPATETSTVTSSVVTSDPSTERVATITPEVPPTATTGPSSDTTVGAGLTDTMRQDLREAGLTDDEINELAAEAATQGTTSEVDPREVSAAADDAVAARVAEETELYLLAEAARRQLAISTAAATTTGGLDLAIGGAGDSNPESRQDDGIGGLTNILGDIYGTIFGTDSTDGNTFVQELPEREGLRRRGGLSGSASLGG
jgi:hypothetical protein